MQTLIAPEDDERLAHIMPLIEQRLIGQAAYFMHAGRGVDAMIAREHAGYGVADLDKSRYPKENVYA